MGWRIVQAAPTAQAIERKQMFYARVCVGGWKLSVVAAAILASSLTLAAQPSIGSGSFDPAYFRMLHWRNIGPNRGGRSIAVAGSSARPFEYYFGAVGGGLWKKT